MQCQDFIKEMVFKINDIRNNEFKKYNFTYEDKIIEKKELNENSMEYKNFKSVIIKKGNMEKMKPGNVGKKVYDSQNEIDILDDVFNSDSKDDDTKLDIDSLTNEEKMNMINDFLGRKNIIFDGIELKKIEDFVNDPTFPLKKYINISKMYKHVIKIGFIKKRENGSYEIDLSEKKQRNTKKFFIK
jgi:hypothetical protein